MSSNCFLLSVKHDLELNDLDLESWSIKLIGIIGMAHGYGIIKYQRSIDIYFMQFIKNDTMVAIATVTKDTSIILNIEASGLAYLLLSRMQMRFYIETGYWL